MAEEGSPNEQRLKVYAQEIVETLHVKRQVGALNPPGDERNAAIAAMTHFLRECGYLVSFGPVNNGKPLDRLALPDRALKVMGDQLRAGHKPYPDGVRERLGLSVDDWRKLQAALVKDGLIDYDNSARSEYRLTPQGTRRYKELAASRARRLLAFATTRVGLLLWTAVVAFVSAVGTIVARTVFGAQ